MGVQLAALGGEGARTTRLGLGCMSLTPGFYGNNTVSEAEAAALLERAYELGVRHFNTSDLYGVDGSNEELLGRVLSGKPGVFISTKWGPDFRDGQIVFDYTRQHCRAACEASLRRLRVPKLQLWTLRGPLPSAQSVRGVMEEVKLLKEEGRVVHVGLSEVSAAHIRIAHAIVPITAIEQEWSLLTRDVETDLLPTCRELGIGIIAYSPIGRGLLSGTLHVEELEDCDFRKAACPRFVGQNLEQNMALVQKVQHLALEKGCTAAELAIAWLLTKGDDVFPIPGTKCEEHLLQNAAAAAITLSADDVARLEEAIPRDAVQGERYEHMGITYHGSN